MLYLITKYSFGYSNLIEAIEDPRYNDGIGRNNRTEIDDPTIPYIPPK